MVSHLADVTTEMASFLLDELGDEVAAAGRPTFVVVGGGGAAGALPAYQRRADVLGWTAPRNASAVGVVATGRLRCLDPSSELPARQIPALAGGMRLCCVVSRRGDLGWRIRLPDGTPFEGPPEAGMMLDILRRCVGLPTAPPEHPVGRLHSVAWMQALMVIGEDLGRRIRWSEALAVHPVTAGRSVADPEEEIRRQAFSGSWEAFRSHVVAHPASPWEPSADLAGWMDEGMFCRWSLSAFPSLEDMMAAVRDHLVPSAARRLAHLVRQVS